MLYKDVHLQKLVLGCTKLTRLKINVLKLGMLPNTTGNYLTYRQTKIHALRRQAESELIFSECSPFRFFIKMTSIFHSVFRKYSTLIKMSSTKPPNENETPKERKPGLRSVQTTMLFRAVNPELFIKPVRGSF